MGNFPFWENSGPNPLLYLVLYTHKKTPNSVFNFGGCFGEPGLEPDPRSKSVATPLSTTRIEWGYRSDARISIAAEAREDRLLIGCGIPKIYISSWKAWWSVGRAGSGRPLIIMWEKSRTQWEFASASRSLVMMARKWMMISWMWTSATKCALSRLHGSENMGSWVGGVVLSKVQ